MPIQGFEFVIYFKVLSLAIILACFIRNKNDDQEAGSYLETENFDLVEHEGQEVSD